MSKVKRVYTFGNKQAEGRADMKNLLGGKGANLAEMNLIGVPVPPGFTITTDVCTEYNQLGAEKVIELIREDVEKSIRNVEQLMKSKFGDSVKSIEVEPVHTYDAPGLYTAVLTVDDGVFADKDSVNITVT